MAISQAMNLIMKETGPNLIENFILDYFSADLEDLLKIDKLNADNSTKKFLDKINMLLDTFAPLKRITKYKLKFKSTPWLMLGLQKPLSAKNKLLSDFISKKQGPYSKRGMSH